MGYRIAHIGAFDMENMGDLLFTDVVAAHMRERLDIDEIVYFSPQSCAIPNTDRTTHSVTLLETMHRDNPFSAIIVGGGDMFPCCCRISTKNGLPTMFCICG